MRTPTFHVGTFGIRRMAEPATSVPNAPAATEGTLLQLEKNQAISMEIQRLKAAGELEEGDHKRWRFTRIKSKPKEGEVRPPPLEDEHIAIWGQWWQFAQDAKAASGPQYFRAGETIVWPNDGDLRALVVGFLGHTKPTVILYKDVADVNFAHKTHRHRTDTHFIEQDIKKFFETAQHTSTPLASDEELRLRLDGWKVHAHDDHPERYAVAASVAEETAPALRKRQHAHAPEASEDLPERAAARRHSEEESAVVRQIKVVEREVRSLAAFLA